MLPLAVYCASLYGAPAYWDTGEAQTVPWIFGIMHPTGFPAFTIFAGMFAHAVPIGSVAWRIALFSALAMSITAWLVARTVIELDGDAWAACAAAWLFAFGPVAWTRGTRAEVHALAVCFAVGALYMALRWLRDKCPRTLILGTLFFGLGIATHPIVVMLLPALMLVLTEQTRALSARALALAALAFFAGLSLYAYLPLRSAAVAAAHSDPTRSIGLPPGRPFWDTDHPASRSGFLREVNGSDYGAGGTFARMAHIRTYRDGVPHYTGVLLDEITAAGALLSIGGLVLIWRRQDATAIVLLVAFALPTAFSLAYTIEADPKRYQLIGFAVVAVFAGAGASWLLQATRAPRWTRALFACAIAALMVILNRGTFDQRTYGGAQQVIDSVLKNTPHNAILISPWIDAAPLAYAAYVQRRLAGRIVESAWLSEDAARVPAWTRKRPVYVVGQLFGEVEGFRAIRVAREPDVYRLTQLPGSRRSWERSLPDTFDRPLTTTTSSSRKHCLPGTLGLHGLALTSTPLPTMGSITLSKARYRRCF